MSVSVITLSMVPIFIFAAIFGLLAFWNPLAIKRAIRAIVVNSFNGKVV